MNFLRLTTNQHTRMKQNKNFKNKNQSKTMPFEGLIKQLKKETLVLVNLQQAKPFVKACFDQKIKVGVGSVYNGGVIIYKA